MNYYFRMKLIKQGYHEEKKSKFYSYLYVLNSFNEYKEALEIIKKKHKKANHHCFAVICNNETKLSNDSEVGSPGRIINDYLVREELNNHILIVSRIFGGVKLGQGGVARAFRKAIENLENL